LDAKDVRIFCEMAFGTTSFSTVPDRQVSPSEIGRRVGLDEKTVRIRVRKMEEDGFIKYYQVMPNLNLFGLGLMGFYRLSNETLATKYNLMSKLHDVPNLVEFIDYLGQFVTVAVAGSDPGEIQRLIDGLTREFMLGARETHQRQIPVSKLKPDILDWQIIKELRYSARRSSTDLAKALRITPRMAEYRIGRLLDSGGMLVRATIDPTRQTGLTFYELELAVDTQHQGAVAAELDKKFGERLWSTVASRGVLFASLFGFSLGEAEDGAIDAGKIEGVKSSLPFVLKKTMEPRGPNWIDRLIEAKLPSPEPSPAIG
jgi:DNA-binding Lrp family transcriptional regulator